MQHSRAFFGAAASGLVRDLLVPAALALLVQSAPAGADTRWQEAAGGAVAILPAPVEATAIVGGSLSCAEQRWSFLFRTGPGTVLAGSKAAARLVIGEEVFETEAREASDTLALAVPRAVLDPLRTGSRLGVSIGDKGGVAKAVFALNGSGKVLDAIAPRCSPVDMSAYRSVTLSPEAPSVETAAGLMKDEAKLFHAASGKKPVFATAMLELNGDRRLLFASLCGSTAYYGASGCTLSGFAAEGATGEWREIYNTEGLALFVDPKASKDGWPDLATLPLDGSQASHWGWSGGAYELRDASNGATAADQSQSGE